MIYLCGLDEVERAKYYARNKIASHVSTYRNYDFKDIGNILTNNPFFPPCNVVQLKNKKPLTNSKVLTPKYNNTFICVEDSSKWKIFTQFEIFKVSPEEYLEFLPLLRKIMEQEAYLWLTNKFKKFPEKLEMELTFLANQYKAKGILSFDDVYSRYSSIENIKLINAVKKYRLGDPNLTKRIIEAGDSELWSIFIGTETKPPYIYYLLSNQQNYNLIRLLDNLRLDVENSDIALKPGLVLLSEKLRTYGS